MYRDTVDASYGNAALNLVDRRARQAIFWRRRALVAAMILLLGVGAFGLPISQTSGVLLAGGHAGALVYRYTNPVLAESFPDPDVVLDGGTYYAYSTNAAGRNVPIASSRDLVSWQIIGDALPQRPSWASTKADAIWAPAVAHAGRSWLLFVTAPDRISGSNLQPAWAVQAAAKVPTDPALSEQVRPRSPIALQGRVFGVRPAFVSGAV